MFVCGDRWRCTQRLGDGTTGPLNGTMLCARVSWFTGGMAPSGADFRGKIQDLWLQVPYRMLSHPNPEGAVYSFSLVHGFQVACNVHWLEMRPYATDHIADPTPATGSV